MTLSFVKFDEDNSIPFYLCCKRANKLWLTLYMNNHL